MLLQLWCQGSCVLGCCAWLRDSADSDRRSDCGRLMLTLVQNRRSRNVSLWFLFSLAVIRVIHTDFSTYAQQPPCLGFFWFPLSIFISTFLCGSEDRDRSQFWFVVLVAHRKLFPTQATSLTLPFYKEKKKTNPFCSSPIGPLWSHVLLWSQFHSDFFFFFILLFFCINRCCAIHSLSPILCTFSPRVKTAVFLCNT